MARTMDIFRIQGGYRLSGQVGVDGSKNAALPIMAASLLIDGDVVLRRVPALLDVATMQQLLCSMGVEIRHQDKLSPETVPELLLNAQAASRPSASYDLVSRMRASICVLGPLIARFGRAHVSLPGGCNIGHRPIDLHLKGLAALGADLRLENGYVIAKSGRLRGADVLLSGTRGSTVTGTCNILTAASTAKGTTVIRGAACEPEVVELGKFLNRAGACIQGLGTPIIEITGVEGLTGNRHTIIGDRIEAATLMIAAAISDGDVLLKDVPVPAMQTVISVLKEIGVLIEGFPIEESKESGVAASALPAGDGEQDQVVRVRRSDRLVPQEIVAVPYPGWPTDAQAQLMALLTLVPGTSIVSDQVFPDRFMHASELIRMGADIQITGDTAIIHGRTRLTGAAVMASDLRASAALVLAALAAEGTSEVHRVHHLDRGYAAFDRKLNLLGAGIQRVDQSQQSVSPDDDQRQSRHFLPS